MNYLKTIIFVIATYLFAISASTTGDVEESIFEVAANKVRSLAVRHGRRLQMILRQI